MRLKKTTGMAIPMVLAFSLVLLVIGTALLKTTRQTNRQNLTNYNQLQAHFIAKAGMEHALLKTKYLHRELYDAICLAQGRNPLFDFSRDIGPTNPGPAFLYRAGEFTPNRYFTPNFNKKNSMAWLDAFIQDLSSENQPCMSFTSPPPAIKVLMHDQFQGGYTVASLTLAANATVEKDAIVKNQSIVEILVQASVESGRGEVWEATLRRTVRISRDND